MILVNNQKVTISELSEMFDIPLDKLEKKPVFEINPDMKKRDYLNKGWKIPVGKQFPSHFFVKHPETKETVEIRYAATINQERVGDKLIDKYSPRKVTFRGSATFKPDVDEAIFFYLSIHNRTSPFRTKDMTKPWTYEFVDDEKRAEGVIESMSLLGNALAHAAKLKGQRLKVTAKGLRISGAEHMDEVGLKAAILQKAQENPGFYMAKVEDSSILFDGLIQDAIDQNVFVLVEKYGVKTWKWGSGPHTGDSVVNVTAGATDSVQALFNHIKADVENYYHTLTNISETVNAESKAKSFLANKNFDFLDKDNDENESGEPAQELYKEIRTNMPSNTAPDNNDDDEDDLDEDDIKIIGGLDDDPEGLPVKETPEAPKRRGRVPNPR